MAPTILFILMASFFVPTHTHLEPTDQAFTSVVLSRQGLDFLKDLLIDKAVSSIIPLELPKIEESVRFPFVGNVDMVLSNTTIYEIDVSESYVKPGDSGIVIIVSGATCNLSMNWYYSYSTWLVLVEISDTGSASVQGRLKLSMMDRRHDEEEKMVAQLYEASLNGCVSTLNTLIQKDPLILDRLTSFSETPLHIVALYGNLEFCRALVSKKPKLVEEVDSLGQTPLHLASAEGHTEIVQALLQANADVCLVRDQDGRIPLHLAVKRGRIEIIEQLIIARPKSILETLDGDSVLHLCVRYNHLDALKLLVVSANCEELFISSKDRDGNSILHLAVMLKQIKAIKYLLLVPEIKREANAMNKIGDTALDVLEVCPRDFKCFEIQNILIEAGVKRSKNLNSSLSLTMSDSSTHEAQPAQSREPARSWFRRWWRYCPPLVKHMKNHGNWIEKTRDTLMLVATVIAGMAFQAAINPPGGVWQENKYKTDTYGFNYTLEAGTSVLAYSYPDSYQLFIALNSTSFFASVCVVLLVTSGFPLTSKFFIWFLSIAMTTAVISMTIAYIGAVTLVTSSDVLEGLSSYVQRLIYVWLGVVLIVGVTQIIRPLYWIVKMLRNFIRKSTTSTQAEDQANV